MGNKSEGKGWRRNIWGTRVREKAGEEIYDPIPDDPDIPHHPS